MTAPTLSLIKPRRPLTEHQFCGWLGSAEPGETLEYFDGFLAMEVTPATTTLDPGARAELARLARRARRAAEAGLVHLVQRRLGPCRFSYRAVARPRPRRAGASLADILMEEAA